jgi:hypothetical protein
MRGNVYPSEDIDRQQKVAAVNQYRYPRPTLSVFLFSLFLRRDTGLSLLFKGNFFQGQPDKKREDSEQYGKRVTEDHLLDDQIK